MVYNVLTYRMYVESSPLQLVLCLVLFVLSSPQLIVRLEELLSQFADLTFWLLRGDLVVCSLHLGLQLLQFSTTPLCLSQELNL